MASSAESSDHAGGPRAGAMRGAVDFGVDALETLLTAGDAPVPAAPLVPTLLPAHLEQWVQTSPRPWPDPDVAPFLHGAEPAEADVQIVWRADLDPTDVRLWPEIVALSPPLQTEALAVPLWAARAWLTAAVAPPVSDLEGGRGATVAPGAQERRPLLWRGPEAPETRIVAPVELRPGDTLVAPAAWGGADEFGWFPDSRQPVVDLADRCAVVRAASAPGARRPYRLRLHPLLLADWLADAPEATGRLARDALNAVLRALIVPEREESPRSPLAALLGVLAEFADPVLAPALAAFRARPPRLVPYPGDQPAGVVLAAAGPLGFTDDDDSSSLTRPVPLTAHGDGVAAWARRFARQCRLPDAVAEDVELAARLHDLGKADARFQLLLHGGDELAAASAAEPLAKSGLDPTRTALLQHARARSGLPRGFRHELVSVALVESEGTLLASARDPDLVKYLIGVHHGRARPFPLVILDETPERVRVEFGGRVFEASSAHGLERLDSGWVDLFWRLNRRYGFWGLAYLEALLRLADWRRSREEQEQ
ncbi:MAG: CRISPR-associated endonuclease Cas3'' [Candidatus Competibacteraceae bacterium]|nr:CRISPR-associated endonuclease Cas3'' [Candidatus Competibacteraceae bacterium]